MQKVTKEGLPIVSEQEAKDAITYMQEYNHLKVNFIDIDGLFETSGRLLDVLLTSVKDPYLNYHLMNGDFKIFPQEILRHVYAYSMILYHALHTAGQRYTPPISLPETSYSLFESNKFKKLKNKNLDTLIDNLSNGDNPQVGSIITTIPLVGNLKKTTQSGMVRLYHALILAAKHH